MVNAVLLFNPAVSAPRDALAVVVPDFVRGEVPGFGRDEGLLPLTYEPHAGIDAGGVLECLAQGVPGAFPGAHRKRIIDRIQLAVVAVPFGLAPEVPFPAHEVEHSLQIAGPAFGGVEGNVQESFLPVLRKGEMGREAGYSSE